MMRQSTRFSRANLLNSFKTLKLNKFLVSEALEVLADRQGDRRKMMDVLLDSGNIWPFNLKMKEFCEMATSVRFLSTEGRRDAKCRLFATRKNNLESKLRGLCQADLLILKSWIVLDLEQITSSLTRPCEAGWCDLDH